MAETGDENREGLSLLASFRSVQERVREALFGVNQNKMRSYFNYNSLSDS